MQRPAKPCTSVRFRSLPPPCKYRIHYTLGDNSSRYKQLLADNNWHKMSIIDTDIDTDRRPMIEHKRNKQIPTDKRRIKRTLGYE